MDPINYTVKEEIVKAAPDRLHLLFNTLNLVERREILYCVRGESSEKTDVLSRSILEKITLLRNAPAEITRKSQRRSLIACIDKFVCKLVDEITYYLGIITARKLYNLVLGSFLTLGTSSEPKGLRLFSEVASPERFLENLVFRESEFDGNRFSNTSLKRVRFECCNIHSTSFINAKLDECVFSHCTFQGVLFVRAQLSDVEFDRCSIIGTSFEEASVVRSCFSLSQLEGTHFFDAIVVDSSFICSTLKDTLFFESVEQFVFDQESLETARVFSPVCALLIDPEKLGLSFPKVHRKLDQSAHTIPLLITHALQNVHFERFNQEIQIALEEIKSQNEEMVPIPQQLLKKVFEDPRKYFESMKVVKKAKRLAQGVDSFCLPGGEDIPPAFYGQKKLKETHFDGDYRRSFFEICLICESVGKGIPLMAICRGFQMANVYFGAQMVQDIFGHKGIQKLYLIDNRQGLYFQAIKDAFFTFVFHHQAIEKDKGPTEYLESSVIYKNLIKASEPKYSSAAPMVLLQFHPEFYKATTAPTLLMELCDWFLDGLMSKTNEVFWKIFSDGASAYRFKKRVITHLKGRF